MLNQRDRVERLGQDPYEQIQETLADNTREPSRIEILSRPRYIFNPGRVLDIAERDKGFKVITRGRIQPIKNYMRYQDTPNRFNENALQQDDLPIYAKHIVEELTSIYFAYSVIECPEFEGIDPELISHLDRTLIPVFPKTTKELISVLEDICPQLHTNDVWRETIDKQGKSLRVDDFLERVVTVYNRNLDVTRDDWHHQMTEVNGAIIDRQNYATTKKETFDSSDIEYAVLTDRMVELDNFNKTLTFNSNQNQNENMSEIAKGFSAMTNALTNISQMNPQPQPQQQVSEPISVVAKPVKDCPECGEEIKAVAKYCRFCEHYLDGRENPKQASTPALPVSEEAKTKKKAGN